MFGYEGAFYSSYCGNKNKHNDCKDSNTAWGMHKSIMHMMFTFLRWCDCGPMAHYNVYKYGLYSIED